MGNSTGRYELYDVTVATHGAALARLARSCEADPDRRQDLLQEIQFALWRSFESFDGRCSPRSWAYRVAHNVAASHVLRDRRHRSRTLVGLEAVDTISHAHDGATHAESRLELQWLEQLLQQLKPLDRQLMLLYLEGLDAASMSEITGLSAVNIATKIHRIKKVLAEMARHGDHDDD